MLKLNNLYFSYNKQSDLTLHNINLNINTGDYLCILGDNGSGKSTLMKLILKFLIPSKGYISTNAKRVGYVPQRFESFNAQFPITVYEMLNIHRKTLKIKDSSEIDRVLSIVKMEAFKKFLVGNLSGGQRQKIFIARALMGNSELLMLDEPSTGVDLDSQREIYSLLKKLNKANNLTVISIEHNLSSVYENCNKVFYMQNGEGTLYASQEFFKHVNRGEFYATI